MAYGLRLYGQFKQQGTELLCDVEIHEQDYEGVASEILLSDTPVIIRLGGSGDKYNPVKGSECTIQIVSQDGEDFSFLYTNDDREFMLIVKVNSLVKFTGFFLVDQYEEGWEYNSIITLTASDQLGLLDSKPYSFGYPAVSPTGYLPILDILCNILSKTTSTKTGLSLNINVANNLFETTMDMAATDDPFDQASLNQDRWINEDLTAVDCLTVLRDILTPFQCRLLQSGGEWWIQRVPDLADSSITYRKFDSSGVYISNASLSPQVEVDNDESLIVLNGGSLKLETGWQQRDIEVDYGLKPSLIPSFSLPDSAFISDTVIAGWTNAGSIWSRIHSTNGNVMAAYTNSRESFNDALYINADPVAVTTDHELNLTIKTGRIENVIFPLYCKVRIFIVDETETTTSYYHDDETWGGEDDIAGINFPRVNTIEELVEQSINIKGIPFNGNLWIRIYAPYRADLANNNGWFYFKDIQLTGSIAQDAGDDHLASQVFTDYIWAETHHIPENEKIRFCDGLQDDSLIPYYNGFIKVGFIGSRLWIKKSLIGVVDPMPLVSHDEAWGCIADSWWWQYSSSNKIFRGSLWGTLWFHQTVLFTEIDDTVFLLDDVEIDLYQNTLYGTFIEIKPETPSTGSGTLTLKSRGLPSAATGSGSGLVPQPGGAENELQVKSGGDFSGATGYSYDPVTGRILKGGTLPLCEYRRNAAEVEPGPQLVTYLETLLETDVFSLDPVIWGWYTDEDNVKNVVSAIPYDISITDFMIDFKVPYTVNFVYTLMINR